MNSAAARIEGSNACRREHNEAFGGMGYQITQESCFSCTCLAGEEEVCTRALHYLQRAFKFWCMLHIVLKKGADLLSAPCMN